MKIKALFASGLLLLGMSAFADNYENSFDSVSSDSAIGAMQKNSLGIGAAYTESLYSGVDSETHAIPLLNLKYQRFFLKGFTLGFNAIQTEKMSADLVLIPLFQGYDASDSDDLSGMDDRGPSAYLGPQVTVRMKPINLTAFAAQDVTGRTTGAIAGAKVGTGLPLSNKLVLVPSIGATYWDSDVTDYYFGVKDSEATSTRAAYSPSGTWVYTGSVSAMYELTQSFLARLTYSYTYYGSEIDDSPITDKDSANTVMLGVSYLF